MKSWQKSALRQLGSVPVPSCHVLHSKIEVDAAETSVRRLGLAANPVRIKSWDNLMALRMIAPLVQRDEPIVDLGCRSGILLTWLSQLRYRKLWGCDLRPPFPPVRSALAAGLWATAVAGSLMYLRHRSQLLRVPVEDTGLPAGQFGVVASMSVIEHGVDTPRFFAEASRLLRPGGLLIVSTDYWPTAIAVGNLRRFTASHGPDRIFNAPEIENLCDEARAAGLLAPTSLDLGASDPVVNSSGFRYTFLTLGFRRASRAN